MPGNDAVIAEISAAVERGRAGDRAGARRALEAMWESVGDDALHRCTVAHFLADLQESVADELAWDERALAAAGHLTDERARQYDSSWQVRSFLPSLHLSVADAHRRCGNVAEARHHLAAALTDLDALPDDQYGALVRTGAEKITQALADGSTAPLAP
ncbi:hypothetical protein [Actinoplanes sp. URMC 104]|uniref:hypothetical protein n=1 Tax=Actinoplanes sp. URMC 104 TaxID=3423409 RepID=UPI003F1CF458